MRTSESIERSYCGRFHCNPQFNPPKYCFTFVTAAVEEVESREYCEILLKMADGPCMSASELLIIVPLADEDRCLPSSRMTEEVEVTPGPRSENQDGARKVGNSEHLEKGSQFLV